MGWIIGTIVAAILAAALLFSGRLLARARGEDGRPFVHDDVRYIGIGIIGVLWLLATIAVSVHQIGAGHVGIVYSFGNITGQRSAGLQLTWPWQTMTNANTQLQTLCFLDDHSKCPDGATPVGDGLNSFSKETQNVFIDAIVNIEVSPTEVQTLYRTVGPNYINKLIPGRIAQIFKDETVKYQAVDLAPSREGIRANVEGALRKEMQPYSIDVKALLIENISFEPAFEAAITAKQVAAQQALEEQQKIAAHKAQADQAIEDARGVAESLKINAEGQASANTTIAASLTPALIQFQAVQKLADNVQIALVPSGQGIIIDPSTLLGTATTP